MGKVVGKLDRQIGEIHAILTVVAFQRNNQWITDGETIKKEFPPEGQVYAPAFYHYTNQLNLKIGRCIEFTVEESGTASESDRHAKYEIPYNSRINPKWPVLHCSFTLIDEYGAVSVEELQSVLEDLYDKEAELTFYINYREQVYGPFKDRRLNRGIIGPKSSKSVGNWSVTDCNLVYSETDKCYLLDEPLAEKGERVDCITDDQLFTWIEPKLRPIVDLRQYEEAIVGLGREQIGDNFSEARIKKFLNLLANRTQTLEQLQQLATAVPIYQATYQNTLQQFRDQVLAKEQESINQKIAHLQQSFDQKKETLEGQQHDLNKQIEELTDQYEQYIRRIEELEKEQQYMKDNRDRLVHDFKLLLPTLHEGMTKPHKKVTTYSINRYIAKTQDPANENDLENNFKQLLEKSAIQPAVTYYRTTRSALLSRIIRVPFIQIPLALANASGNADCFVQQVAPNWLTFQHFREAVLDDLLAYCREHSDRIIFLILQDIDVASPSCYARPFFDVHKGVRHHFPGTDRPWPENLWAFLTDAPQALSLPIIESIFEGCQIIPPFPETSENPGTIPARSIADYPLSITAFSAWTSTKENGIHI